MKSSHFILALALIGAGTVVAVTALEAEVRK